MGIGHSIWLSEDSEVFYNTFPVMIKFLVKNNVDIPEWMKEHYNPWKIRDNFIKDEKRRNELKSVLIRTKIQQVFFIVENYNNSLAKIVSKLLPGDREMFIKKICLLKNDPRSIYAMLDYSNFKGNGFNDKGEIVKDGWGLLQVIQNMKLEGNSLLNFVQSTKFVLKRRIKNNPKDKIWLEGWMKRVNSYLE